MGDTLHDYSEFGNTITIVRGDPILIDGSPFDYGIATGGTKSTALKINRPTSELGDRTFIKIDHHSRYGLSGATQKSFFIRFRLHSLSQRNGFDATLYYKIDDDTADNGVWIAVNPSGRVKFQLKKAGVAYNSQTASSTITTNVVYEVWCTYNTSGNVMHIYVNNVDQSLTDPGTPTWGTSTSHHGQVFGRSYDLIENGYVYGDFYDFMVMNKTVSATEVGRHYTNKWTIADIPFGQVMVTDYYATYEEDSGAGGYDSIGFDSTGFDT